LADDRDAREAAGSFCKEGKRRSGKNDAEARASRLGV
jgi:hypothetical protein